MEAGASKSGHRQMSDERFPQREREEITRESSKELMGVYKALLNLGCEIR